MGRRPRGNGQPLLPSADMLIMRQLLEKQFQEQVGSLVKQITDKFGEVERGFVLAQRSNIMLDQKVNLALQTIELIKQGLEEKGVLTQEDLNVILKKQLDQQQQAREILGDDTLTEEEKIKKLQEEAGLSETEAPALVKTYNDAVKQAAEAGTKFVGADGPDDSGGDEKEGEDGSGDQSGSKPTESGEANPHIRSLEP